MRSKVKAATKRRPGRVQRRKDLLGAVYKVISESGIEGASLRQIADRANVSTGTINYHFGNKQKLVMAALQAAYLMPLERDESSSSPLARLKAVVFSHIFRSPADRFWRFWINCAAAGTRNTALSKHQNQRLQSQQTSWSKLIQTAIDAGELSRCENARAMSEQMLIFAHGLVMRQILQPDAASRRHCENLLEKYFEALEQPRHQG